MQVNGINSYSAPKMAFKGEGAEEKKGINKKAAIAAGVGAAAVIGATVAAGLRGKSVLNNPDFIGPQEKGIKKAIKCVKLGFGEAIETITKKGNELIEQVKDKFAKKAPEAEKAAEEAMQ